MQPKAPQIMLYCNLTRMGGIESHIVALSRLLADHGAQVIIAARSNSLDRSLLGALRSNPAIHVDSTSDSTTKSWFFSHSRLAGHLDFLRRCALWRRLYGFESCDLVSVNANGSAALIMGRFVRPGGLLTYHEHTDFVRDLATFRKSLDACSFVTVNAPQIAAKIRSVGVANPRLSVLPALTLTEPPPHAISVPREAEPAKLRLALLGGVGQPDADIKGHYRLLRLWPQLEKLNCQLSFYGGGATEVLDKAVAELRLPNVSVRGPYLPKDLPQIMAECDLLLLPTQREGLGLVLIEAMAFGVPFVATAVGGVPSLGEDNPDVLVVPNDDESFVQGVTMMVERIRAGAISSDRLRGIYDRRFSRETLGRRWIDAYLHRSLI